VIPVVNERYKYIFLYSAKSACTSLRSLYIGLHRDEFDQAQRERLDGYHNLNEAQPLKPGRDYSGYFTYLISRNPYARAVSAFLDQYVYLLNDGVAEMFKRFPPKESVNQESEVIESFLEFLEYLLTVPDGQRDSHFQTQTYFAFADDVVWPNQGSKIKRLIQPKAAGAMVVDYTGDVSDFKSHLTLVFEQIFKGDPGKLDSARKKLDQLKKSNSSFYGEQDFENAALMSKAQLDGLVFAPKPQDFYTDVRVRRLVEEIYKLDFQRLGYKLGEIPQKRSSSEIKLVPTDFDWQMYLRLNPDLPRDEIYNERSVVRHYLEFGRFESTPRAYKIEAPAGFDWQRYLSLNADLPSAGIDSEAAAVEHFISYGVREGRAT